MNAQLKEDQRGVIYMYRTVGFTSFGKSMYCIGRAKSKKMYEVDVSCAMSQMHALRKGRSGLNAPKEMVVWFKTDFIDLVFWLFKQAIIGYYRRPFMIVEPQAHFEQMVDLGDQWFECKNMQPPELRKWCAQIACNIELQAHREFKLNKVIQC